MSNEYSSLCAYNGVLLYGTRQEHGELVFSRSEITGAERKTFGARLSIVFIQSSVRVFSLGHKFYTFL